MITIFEAWRLRLSVFAAVLFAVCFFGFVEYNNVFVEPKAILMQARLQKENRQIVIPRSFTRTGTMVGHKSSNAWVATFYSDSKNSQDLRSYFQSELTRRGWVYCNVRDSILVSEVTFRKDLVIATLSIDRTHPGEYGLNLTWDAYFWPC